MSLFLDPGVDNGQPFEGGVLFKPTQQLGGGIFLGAGAVNAGLTLMHVQERLDFEKFTNLRHGAVHPSAAPQVFKRFQRGKNITALHLGFQNGQNLIQRVTGGGQVGRLFNQKTRPHAELARIEDRDRQMG